METRFGKFRLVKHIGGGRLSQVFKVAPLHLDDEESHVALKRVTPSMIGEPAYVQLVVREAKVLTSLSHEHLCRCLELGVVDGSAFLTMELVDGCTLRAVLRRLSMQQARMPRTAIVGQGYQLAVVLEYLHRQTDHKLVHLDLSPQNVMISRAGELKLIDFGLARYLDGHNPPPLGGKIAGTVGYMSPEQASGGEVDERADQYGLGVLLWEMLANRRLFRGNNAETWRRMRAGEVPPADAVFPSMPLKLTHTIYRMLSPNPADRFSHMGAVAAALKGCASSPRRGQNMLAEVVEGMMYDPDFDPFDSRLKAPTPTPEEQDIPAGEAGDEDDGYAELSIQVDHGQGSPTSQVRTVIPLGGAAPDSPFLETIPEAPPTDSRE